MNEDFCDTIERARHRRPRSLGPANGAGRGEGALRAFGAPLAAHGVGPAELSKEDVIYQLGLPPRRIDILTSIDGVSFEEAWEARVEQVVAGLEVPVRGRKELLRNKRAAGRPKVLADIALLEELEG